MNAGGKKPRRPAASNNAAQQGGWSRSSRTPAPTTTLDVVDYAVTRAAELKALRNASRDISGNRRVYQQLAWHSRRRTMSHSSHRMPARLRVAHTAQLVTQGAVKPPGVRGFRRLRKYRQKARFLMSVRKLRAANPRWLETHIWHAKRFRMGHVGDRCVAEKCNDRGYRSAYRAVTRGCVAHDASYRVVIQVTADTVKHLTDRLREHLNFEDGRRATTDPVTTGTRFVTDLVVYKHDRAIAPCDILWCPSKPCLWLWTRPEATEEILSALTVEGAQARRLPNQPVCFRLFGPRTGAVLRSVIACDQIGMTFVTRSRDPRCLPSGCLVAGIARDPRPAFPPKTVGAHMGEIGDCGDPGDVFRQVQHSPLWDETARHAFRERALHKSDKTDACEVPFFLLQRCDPPSWDLILPSGWGMPFWVSLMYANSARAIGTEEHRLLRLETQRPLFPEDFPDSDVAISLLRLEEKSLREAYERRPRGKRVNYTLNRITSAMFPALNEVSHSEQAILGRESDSKRPRIETVAVARGHAHLTRLVGDANKLVQRVKHGSERRRRKENRVALHKKASTIAVGEEHCGTFARVVLRAPRGVPEKNAIICEPLEADGDRNGEELREVRGGKGHGPSRRVVGYVSMGGYALANGAGVGTGFVAVSALLRMANEGRVCALFRNTSGLHYRMAELRVLDR